jgi:hypothetical protein
MMTIAKCSAVFVALFTLMAVAQIAGVDPVIPPGKLNINNNDIPNWSPDTTMQLYVGDELYLAIDGGAVDFLNGGCISAGIQHFTGPDSVKARSFVMDFGTSEKAKAMFLWEKSQYGPYMIIYPPYPDSVVSVDSSFFFSLDCIAHFDNLYLQIDVFGIPDWDSGFQALNAFLGFYVQRIKEYEISALLRPHRLESGAKISREEFSVTRGRAGNDFIVSVRNQEPVLVKIYDISGHEIASLVSKTLAPGPHSFSWNTRNIASGCYTVRMRAGSETCVRSVPVVR